MEIYCSVTKRMARIYINNILFNVYYYNILIIN